jgi:hypothetical protein
VLFPQEENMQKYISPYYYVQANGNDQNDGLSANMPFKTLAKAIDMAKHSDIKSIVIGGTLDEKSESSASAQFPHCPDGKSIFYIRDSGKELITIKGKNNAQLKGKYAHANFNDYLLAVDAKRIIRIAGNSNILFENIVIIGGNADPNVEEGLSIAEGGGLLVSANATVTLGEGSVVRRNYACWRGGGAAVIGGTLILAGGEICNNTAMDEEGGGVFVGPRNFSVVDGKIMDDPLSDGDNSIQPQAKFIVKRGNIINNFAFRGGGICIREGGVAEIENGLVKGNHSCHGGGIYIGNGSRCNMSGGIIRENNADKKSDMDYLYLPLMLHHGGGIFIDGGMFEMAGGSVIYNKAKKGGGVYLSEMSYSKGEFITSVNGIIKNNKAYEGSDIWTFPDNNIFKKNDNINDAGIFYATEQFIVSQYEEAKKLSQKNKKL